MNETSNITVGHFLQDPVAEVGREPADHELVGVLIPEEVDSHAAAVLAGVAPDNVELQECPLISPDGIVDVVGLALLSGAAPADGTGEVHAELGERISECLVRGLAALPDQVCAESIQLHPEDRVLLLVVFGFLGRLFQFARAVGVLIFRRLQLPLERGDVVLHRQFPFRGIGKVSGVGYFKFGSQNPRIRHKVKTGPVGAAGGRDPMGCVDQKRSEAPFPAFAPIVPRPDIVFEVEWMVRRRAVVEIDLREADPAGPVEDRMFKEALRTIYSRAETSYHARIAFHRWIKLAEEIRIPELRTMTKTLRDKIEGIISFWIFRHISKRRHGRIQQ